MSWNYRVMQSDGELAIYEVYYDADGKVIGSSESPVFPHGENLEELRADLAHYSEALSMEVLEYKN